MATQSLAPDTLLVQTNLTGALSLIQDDPDLTLGTDTSWMEATSDSTAVDLRVGFPTPSGSVTAGATQTLKAKVRKSAALGNAGSAALELWEAGASKVVGASVTVTDEVGQILTLTFTDASLADKTGAGVELRVVGTQSGGKTTDRRVIDVAAVEWDVVYDVAVANVNGTAIVAGGGGATLVGGKASPNASVVAGGGVATPVSVKAASAASQTVGGGSTSAAAAKSASASPVVAGGGDAVPTGTASVTAPALSGVATIAGGGSATANGLRAATTAAVVAGGGTPSPTAVRATSGVAVAAGGGTPAPATSGVAPAASDASSVTGGGDAAINGGVLAAVLPYKQALAHTKSYVSVG